MRFRFVVAIMIMIALSAIPAAAQAPKAAAKAWTPPSLPDGHPDLQGIWNYSTLTPVERPKDLADKPVFSEQEAAAYQKRLMQTRNVDLDRETAPTARAVVNGTVETADLANAYNAIWWDRGTQVVNTRRTSLALEPPDATVP